MKQVELLHIVANRQPATVDEIIDGHESAKSTVQGVVTELWRQGYLVRRRRDTKEHGANPYEYAVSELEAGSES